MSKESSNVIVGAGHCGARAAETMREAGFDGRIIMIGDEKVRPYERPALSKEILLKPGFEDNIFIHAEAFFAKNHIDLVLGKGARAIDVENKSVELADGHRVTYDKLLLATGSRVRHLPHRLDANGLFYLRTLDESLALRRELKPGRSLVLIGGGVIGLEIAAAAVALGCRVTVLEALDRVMARSISVDIANFMHHIHKRHGVDIRLNSRVSEIKATSDGFRIALESSDQVEADHVLVAIGIIPNCELAQTAGIVTDNGILVDECGRTNVENIYAAGEVTNHTNSLLKRNHRLENWQHAENHGRHVGAAMCGRQAPYSDIPWFWTDQYDINLQVAGDPFGSQTIRREQADASKFTLFHVHESRVVGASAINNARDIRAAKKLIASGRQVDMKALADPDADLKSMAA